MKTSYFFLFLAFLSLTIFPIRTTFAVCPPLLENSQLTFRNIVDGQFVIVTYSNSQYDFHFLPHATQTESFLRVFTDSNLYAKSFREDMKDYHSLARCDDEGVFVMSYQNRIMYIWLDPHSGGFYSGTSHPYVYFFDNLNRALAPPPSPPPQQSPPRQAKNLQKRTSRYVVEDANVVPDDPSISLIRSTRTSSSQFNLFYWTNSPRRGTTAVSPLPNLASEAN
jgi:hypothetical protein